MHDLLHVNLLDENSHGYGTEILGVRYKSCVWRLWTVADPWTYRATVEKRLTTAP
jgi:hypothetical protein